MKNPLDIPMLLLTTLFVLLAGSGTALASAADTTTREENIQTIRSFLGEEGVQTALQRKGISAEQVEEVTQNLDRLSDSQIQTLAMNLDRPEGRPEESPAAGGAVESADWGKDAGYKAIFLILIALVIIVAIMYPTFPQLLPLLGA